MKNKEKIIGSIVILCISIVVIIAGYKMSGSRESVSATDYKDIFLETDKAYEKKDTKAASATKSNIAIPSNAAASTNTVEDINIKVDIKGAVAYPGVYEIKKGSRIIDLINLAGGPTLEADLSVNNLSIKLNDEDCVEIHKKGEVDKVQTPQTKPYDVKVSSSTVIKAIININTASKEELMTLTGIGEVKADGIIKYREENGGFNSVDELTKVDGIGEKTLSKFIDKVDIKWLMV